MNLPEFFLTPSKPERRPITAAKKNQGKKERGKKIQKSKSLKL